MCGIVGMLSLGDQRVSARAIANGVAAITSRGPDGHGVWLNPEEKIGLGYRRLAIIDLPGGVQPQGNEDDSIHVVFNGEIYNYLEIRESLAKQGHRFRTKSDTEVLVHLYEQYDTEMFSHLRGMYAFALWDEPRGRLLLGRDPLGKKPLYFSRQNGQLAFASEIKGLLPLLNHVPRFTPRGALDFFTWQYVPSRGVGFENIEQLPPGSWLSVEQGREKQGRHWKPPDRPTTFAGDFNEAAAKLRSLLREATSIRLRSDVPVGVLLSGGLDSACVTGLAAECGGTLNTFTATFNDQEYDERVFAQAVADRFGTAHHTLEIDAPNIDELNEIVDYYDEPFADSSAIATYLICRKASEHVKVALTGDGGDESLLGYTRYVQLQEYARRRRWGRPLMRLSLIRWLGMTLCPNPTHRTWRRRLRTLGTAWDPTPAEAYERWITIFNQSQRRRLFSKQFFQELGAPDDSLQIMAQDLQDKFRGSWPAAAAEYDLVHYLCDDILVKVDRASMAHGLECRSPFLDSNVVEFLSTIPAEWKLHPRHGSKWILREACRDLLPEMICRRDKMGFGVPVGDWIRRGLVGNLLKTRPLPDPLDKWLDATYLDELLREHTSGEVDHTFRLWAIYVACRTLGRQNRG